MAIKCFYRFFNGFCCVEIFCFFGFSSVLLYICEFRMVISITWWSSLGFCDFKINNTQSSIKHKHYRHVIKDHCIQRNIEIYLFYSISNRWVSTHITTHNWDSFSMFLLKCFVFRVLFVSVIHFFFIYFWHKRASVQCYEMQVQLQLLLSWWQTFNSLLSCICVCCMRILFVCRFVYVLYACRWRWWSLKNFNWTLINTDALYPLLIHTHFPIF